MITIRLWGARVRAKRHLAEWLTAAFEKEGGVARAVDESALQGDRAVVPLVLQAERTSTTAVSEAAGEVVIVLDEGLADRADIVSCLGPGVLIIENAGPATPSWQTLPSGSRLTRCDADSLASCYEAGHGNADAAVDAVAAAMAGAFSAVTGYVRLRSIIDAVPLPAAQGPDLRDAVLAGFTTVVGASVDTGGALAQRG